MAIQAAYLKITRRQAVVKLTGTGQYTIDLANLVHTSASTGLVATTQSFTRANCICTISDIAYDISAAQSNVTRGSNIIWAMTPGPGAFNFTQNIGVALDQDANANVIINIAGSSDGSVILQFSKGLGFNDVDLQNVGR